MMMKTKISNVAELHAEIARLKNIKIEQEAFLEFQVDLLKAKVTKPFHFFQQLFSFIPGADLLNKVSRHGSTHEDWLSKSLRIGLPFLINRVFFRKAGYIKRIVMGLLSSQAAGLLNKERLAHAIDAVTAWIKKDPKKKARDKQSTRNYNFGIPPDSETY